MRAFILVRDIFGLEPLWLEIDALDNKVPAPLQYEMLIDVGPPAAARACSGSCAAGARSCRSPQVLEIFRPGARGAAGDRCPAILSRGDRAAWEAYVARLATSGVPQALARAPREPRVALRRARRDRSRAGAEEGHRRRSPRSTSPSWASSSCAGSREKITALPTDTSWQALARNALRDDLSSQQRAITQAIAKLSPRIVGSAADARRVEGALRAGDRAPAGDDRRS